MSSEAQREPASPEPYSPRERAESATESKYQHVGHFEKVHEVCTLYAAEMAELRALLEREEADDVVVYLFLRGYKFKPDKAAEALNKMHAWRDQNGMDEIRAAAKGMRQEEFPHATRMMKCHPHNVSHGTDRDGQPLSLERIGHSDPQLLTKLLTMDELMQYHLYHIENKAQKMADLTASTGTVMRTCKIMDLSGLGTRALHQGGLKYLRTLLRVSQDNYPEMLGNVYVINAPMVFQLVWKVVKPWLHPKTLEKIQILGGNYAEVLREKVDPDNLPTWAGGSCECEGGCVVEMDPDHDMVEVSVRARGSETVEIDVPEAQWVNYEYRTRSKDLAFGVSFLPRGAAGEDDAVEVLKAERAPAARGDYEAPGPGTLRLHFDNTFSYMTAKTALYRVDETPVPTLISSSPPPVPASP